MEISTLSGARIVLILLCLVAVGGTVLRTPSRIRPGPPSGGHPPIPPCSAQFYLHISYICLFSGPMQSCACRMGTHARLASFAGRGQYCVVVRVVVVMVVVVAAVVVPTLLSFSRRFFLSPSLLPPCPCSMLLPPLAPGPWPLPLPMHATRSPCNELRLLLDGGRWTVDCGPWDCRPSTFDSRLSTMRPWPMAHDP